MKTLFIIIAIIIVVILIKACTSGDKLASDTARPANATIPSDEKANDKIIIVDNVNHDDIKKALNEFCNIYNKSNFLALPRLWQLSPTSYAVTFPYDIDFATYCFAINFLKYPMDIKWQSKVYAWATTKTGDEWITDKSANKSVMLFLANDDKEYDNVFLTTQDNIGYKLGFAAGKQNQLLDPPKEFYKNPTISINSLTNKEHQDFK